MYHQRILEEVFEVFTASETDSFKLSEAIKQYRTMLFGLSDLDMDTQASRSDIHFKNGKAIGLTWAATCVDDMIRTQRFIRGIYLAVSTLKDQKESPIHIFYAGTGPFATLVLPLLTHFSEEDIQLTLLEVNKMSYENVQRIFKALGFEGFIKEIINADATAYQIKQGTTIDILLSETMQNALNAEQQVPITMHLANQISNEFILIPEEINLHLGLLNYTTNQSDSSIQKAYKKLYAVFQLSQKSIRKFNPISAGEEGIFEFPKVEVNLPKSLLDSYSEVVIFTEIKVFAEEIIHDDDSGLTIPWTLHRIRDHKEEDLIIRLQYVIDRNPGLHYQILTDTEEISEV